MPCGRIRRKLPVSYTHLELGKTQQLAETGEAGLDEVYRHVIKQKTLDDAMELLETELIKMAERFKAGDAISNDQMIKKACEYIEEHFAEPGLRIGEVAGHTGLSPNYFSSVFTEAVSYTHLDVYKRQVSG